MPLPDAAASPDAATRLRSMVDLATPFAIRVVASLRVADQLAAGVQDANAIAAVDADLVPAGVYRGQRGLVLLEYACAPR